MGDNPFKGWNKKRVIKGRRYSGHALDKMQEREILPSNVEGAIKNGEKLAGRTPREIKIRDTQDSITVIIRKSDEKVVTVRWGTK